MHSIQGIVQAIGQSRVGALTAAATIVVGVATAISAITSSYYQEDTEIFKQKGNLLLNIFYQNPPWNYKDHPEERMSTIKQEVGYLIQTGVLPDDEGSICKAYGLGPAICETDKPGFIRRTFRFIGSYF